jgi:hypothetical protein
LFWDIYCANGFDINTFQVFRYHDTAATKPWEVSDYVPGTLDRISFGGLDDAMYGIICVVTRTERSTGHRIPQQGMYLDRWQREGTVQQDFEHEASLPALQLANSSKQLRPAPVPAPAQAAHAPASSPPLIRPLKRALQVAPPLYRLLRSLYHRARIGARTTAAAVRRLAASCKRPFRPKRNPKGLGLKVIARY